jgi:hypothetical protein
MRQLNQCKDCKFCARLFDYEQDSHLLFCDNDHTKKSVHPIGFLVNYDAGCEFFEKAREEKARYDSVDLSPEGLNASR